MPSEPSYLLIDQFLKTVNLMRCYHRHQVIGLGRISTTGKTLLVVNHSLATYDIFMLFAAIYENLLRLPRPLADRLFFKIPGFQYLIKAVGGVVGSPENASELLRNEQLVAVAPGGMREALRPSSEKYQLKWEKRKGFARLSIDLQCPINIAVCPRADDLYSIYQNPFTGWIYRKLKVPIFLARGFGLSPLPKPIVLRHFVSPTVYPPSIPSAKNYEKILNKYHQKLIDNAEDLMHQSLV